MGLRLAWALETHVHNDFVYRGTLGASLLEQTGHDRLLVV
jgi:hypothetical protein